MSSLSDLSPCCIKLQCLNSSRVLDLILSFPIFLKINSFKIFQTHQGMFWSSGWDFPKENFEVSSLIESFFGSRGCPIWKASQFYSVSENHLEQNALATPRFNIYFLIFLNFLFSPDCLVRTPIANPLLSQSKHSCYVTKNPHSRKRRHKAFHFDICGSWNHWHKGKHFHLKQSKW